jgi:general secretion pathway protein H
MTPMSNLALVKANQKGFTLLEILIVLGIIGAIVALGLSRIRKRDNDIRKVMREFYVLGKEVRNHARLKNSTFRLVIEMNESGQKYWVESAQGFQGRINEEDLKKLREEERPQEVFQKDNSVVKKDKTLPSGLFFKIVETIGKDPVQSGKAYIYFFSNGFVEASSLQVTDRKKATWTVVFHPLTGQADIIPEEKSLKDVQQD